MDSKRVSARKKKEKAHFIWLILLALLVVAAIALVLVSVYHPQWLSALLGGDAFCQFVFWSSQGLGY